AGITRHVSLTRDGDITAADRTLGYDVHGRVSSELVDQVAELLEHARPAKPSTGPVIPDDVYSTLTIVAAGRKDEIEPSPQIDALLRQAAERAVQQAVVGTWREWRWKLCHPAAKLTASDVDPRIDALQFRADGRFEVTWPGGGAYTIGIPHIPVPDYAGRYT